MKLKKGGANRPFSFCRDYVAELEACMILSSGARYGASDGISFGTCF
jgi:hypothetical protein